MTDIALVPERHVLKRHDCVAANHAGQAAQTLVCDRVAFVRHGGAAFLAFAEKFFDFENFGALKMPKFGRPAIDARGNYCERSHEFRVSVALHDLR